MRSLNRGAGMGERMFEPHFPDAGAAIRADQESRLATLDLLFVNPPAPDGGIWIRSQHRVGRRSREGMIWPQVGLAQLAALFPDYRVEIVDAIALRMDWPAFERLLEEKRPRYYVTQVTAPTLRNDMYGAFVARSLGATTVAFGPHVTAIPNESMRAFPALDYVLRGEPELTLRELVDSLEALASSGNYRVGVDAWGRSKLPPGFRDRLRKLYADADPEWRPAWLNTKIRFQCLWDIKGLVWRQGGDVIVNQARPFIRNLDDLPLPRHDLLPLERYQAPLVGGPYAFVVTSRGCPMGCRFCIKHITYGNSVRFRSAEHVLTELQQLRRLGVSKVHMYADLFTVNREQVVEMCNLILDRGLDLRWTCNSRVDFVDPEMLQLMATSGCWMISWGIESGSEEVLKRAHKGITLDRVELALGWAKEAGIRNWGYFIIGLPGETEETIQQTIDFAKQLPIDLALFHVAAPYPGTPLFFEVMQNGWFRNDTCWEQVDMDRSTVLDYPNLSAEALEMWAQRAFRAWAFRPGPILTFLAMCLTSPTLVLPALRIGWESFMWAIGGKRRSAAAVQDAESREARHPVAVYIEDEPQMIQLLALILKRMGVELIGVEDGIEGLDVVRRVKPDLVLLDLMLPGMSGWDVYRRMKADVDLRNIPVIVVTVKADMKDRVLGMQVYKVNDYVTKPFNVRDLLQSVSSVLKIEPAQGKAGISQL